MSTPGDAEIGATVPAAPATDPGGPPVDPTPAGPMGALVRALRALRDTLTAARFGLPVPGADTATASAHALADQLDDYLLPRLSRLDAPLLVVVGGSTGAGKSTLVNSLVRAPVSPSGVLRPTTRAPVLVCHPADTAWFARGNVLPGLARSTAPTSDPNTLQVVSAEALSAGLAFLDAPDIDSVVDANRALAAQLLAAADLWLFVTTAARYADAVPWGLLRTARSRGTVVALVLDRVPAGAADQIGPHLTAMLRENELGGVQVFVLPETRLDGTGLLDERLIAPLREWFARLASSVAGRAAVVRQTVEGALTAAERSVVDLAAAANEQSNAVKTLRLGVGAAYRTALGTVEHGVRDGTLLRGEVLARWQELVGTGDLMRALQARVGRLRDRLTAALTGRAAPGSQFQAALESGLVALVRSAAADAAEQATTAWRAHPAGDALLRSAREAGTDLGVPGPGLSGRVERMVRDWQRDVLELVRTEAGGKLTVARASAYAVNATGLLVMVAVFTATAFIPTGAEVAVAGGTTVAAQKLLEAIFGDQAVRSLADKARADLIKRVQALFAEEEGRYLETLDATGITDDDARRLRAAAAAVTDARRAAPLPRTEQAAAPPVVPATEAAGSPAPAPAPPTGDPAAASKPPAGAR